MQCGAHELGRALGFGACLTVSLQVVSSCRQLVGIDERDVARRTSTELCGGFATPLADCAACVNERCCSEATACGDNPACVDAFGCLAACGGDVASVAACRVACRSSLESVMDAAAARILACQARSCVDACRLTCGGYLHASASCEACAYDACCAEARSCAEQGSCQQVLWCSDDCPLGDGPCRLACQQSSGAQAADGLRACMNGGCATCGEPQWSCLGSVAWPPATTSSVEWNVYVQDFLDLSAVPADVRFCEDTDVDCTAPLAQGQANAAGNAVSLTIPVDSAGFFSVSGAGVQSSRVHVDGPTTVERDVFLLAFTPAGFASLGPLDLTRGQLVTLVTNCDGKLAHGVTFSIEDASMPPAARYWLDGAFSASALATGVTGAGAFFDVPMATATIAARVATTDTLIRRRTVTLRAGEPTFVFLAPAP